MSFILFLIAMYWLPTIIAMVRRTPSVLGIAVLNFFLGWTVHRLGGWRWSGRWRPVRPSAW